MRSAWHLLISRTIHNDGTKVMNVDYDREGRVSCSRNLLIPDINTGGLEKDLTYLIALVVPSGKRRRMCYYNRGLIPPLFHRLLPRILGPQADVCVCVCTYIEAYLSLCCAHVLWLFSRLNGRAALQRLREEGAVLALLLLYRRAIYYLPLWDTRRCVSWIYFDAGVLDWRSSNREVVWTF